MIKITYLNDNLAGPGCEAEHGFSCLVETDIRFLFDTGPSGVTTRNARVLGIDLDAVPMVVLSHGHYDHTGGLPYLGGKDLVCHPDAFSSKHRESDGSWIGMPLPGDEIRKMFRVTFSSKPLWLSDHTVFLGEIPRASHFESKTTPFVHPDGSPDFMPDDSGVALLTPSGLVILSGCAHAGIVNMVSHAKLVTGVQKVRAVLGGFHLKEDNEVTHKTVEALKEMNVAEVYPSHCTAPVARDVFRRTWEFQEITSGSVVYF